LKSAINSELPDVQVAGNEKGKPRSGAFEVTTDDGELIYSKLTVTNRKPTDADIAQIVSAIQNKTQK